MVFFNAFYYSGGKVMKHFIKSRGSFELIRGKHRLEFGDMSSGNSCPFQGGNVSGAWNWTQFTVQMKNCVKRSLHFICLQGVVTTRTGNFTFASKWFYRTGFLVRRYRLSWPKMYPSFTETKNSLPNSQSTSLKRILRQLHLVLLCTTSSLKLSLSLGSSPLPCCTSRVSHRPWFEYFESRWDYEVAFLMLFSASACEVLALRRSLFSAPSSQIFTTYSIFLHQANKLNFTPVKQSSQNRTSLSVILTNRTPAAKKLWLTLREVCQYFYTRRDWDVSSLTCSVYNRSFAKTFNSSGCSV
jgi:hypothetical protein